MIELMPDTRGHAQEELNVQMNLETCAFLSKFIEAVEEELEFKKSLEASKEEIR